MKSRSYKYSNRSRKRKKRIIRSIRAIMIVFIAFILSTAILKSIDTMSLGTNKDTIVDNKDKINVIRDDEKELKKDSITTSESDNIDNSSKNEENLEGDQIVYLPLEADSNATDAREVQNRLTTWNYQSEDNKKVAYLTFDDGPSEYVTDEILDVLKEKDVKATFFVLGSMIDKNDYAKKALKRIVKEGHAIGNHGYCHRYDVLYPGDVVNVDNFMADMKKSEDAMKEVLGDSFSTNVIRFPGGHGSWDTSAIDPVLHEKGYSYIDWNTLNGDAEGQGLSADHLLDRLKETVSELEGNNDVIVVLMHDTDAKQSTAQYLADAIDYLRSQGYEFKTLK
ncbi:polysaccharide deacetylase [Clostridium saudiense]|nr:polysaccharide deacetylase [Clostridium saudiense]